MKYRIGVLLVVLGLVWVNREKINKASTQAFYNKSTSQPTTGHFFDALAGGETGILDLYINKMGLSPEVVQDGDTLLIRAIKSGEISMVRFLVENGANVNNPDPHGKKPLSHAKEREKPPIIEYLIEKGANESETKIDFSSTYGGKSQVDLYLLYWHATESRDVSKAIEIIQGGLDPNFKTDTGAYPVLGQAISIRSGRLLRFLFEKGVVPSRDSFFAILREDFSSKEEVFDAFMAYNVDFLSRDKNGKSAIEILREKPSAVNGILIEKLIKAGANPN